jgi:preprotein translocase subunit YajC
VPASAQLLVILVAMIAFWAIVMRPARTQQRKVAELQSGLEVGEEVMLSSGIFGTVHALSEGRVELEVAPGTVVTVARQAVVRRVDADEHTPEATHDEPGETTPPATED